MGEDAGGGRVGGACPGQEASEPCSIVHLNSHDGKHEEEEKHHYADVQECWDALKADVHYDLEACVWKAEVEGKAYKLHD